MKRMICMVTGPIIGLHSGLFLKQTIEYAKRLGIKIAYFNLFDEIIELEWGASLNQYERAARIGELLNGYQYQFKLMREKAYLSIRSKINDLPKEIPVLIRTASVIPWRGIYRQFKDQKFISKHIKPNRFVTLIDAEWKMRDAIKSEYGEHAFNRIIQEGKFDIEDILQWIAYEVSTTEDWAEWCSFVGKEKIGHVVLGERIPMKDNRELYVPNVEAMAKLATQKNIKTFYASYSMSQATDDVRHKVNADVWKLKNYGVVIDPASIEIGQDIDAKERDIVFSYTVNRDLRWDVEKVDAVVAFHPYKKRPPLSTGMMDEIGHARAAGIERYFIFPTAKSPFTENNYIPKKHLKKNSKEFYDYLEKKRRPTLSADYKDFTDEFIRYYSQKFPEGLKKRRKSG